MTSIMKLRFLFFYLYIVNSTLFAQSPISLHPENPHYFLYKGKPKILISSAEHYGLVLNSELDYKIYLNVLEQYGFNQTRIFSGAYCEGNSVDTDRDNTRYWREMQNTLAPRPNQFITPWQRSNEPGYINGGNKFDLNRWNEAYFSRLKDFCAEAEKHNVIVEVVLFTANYRPTTWLNSPLNAKNNINDVPLSPCNVVDSRIYKEIEE